MNMLELAVTVIGIVGLVRKLRPTIDGWQVIALAGGIAVGLTWAATPPESLFMLLVKSGRVTTIAIGLVTLVDRLRPVFHSGGRPGAVATPRVSEGPTARPSAHLHRMGGPLMGLLLLVGVAGAFPICSGRAVAPASS